MCSINIYEVVIYIFFKAMDKKEQNNLLAKIARLYYVEDMNQQAIADRLGISRTKVSRSITKAKRNKIVEIKINSHRERFDELEAELENRYLLKECRIVPSYDDEKQIYKDLSSGLAGILDRLLKDGDLLGVGWGKTLRSVADFIEPLNNIEISVIPLLGGLGKSGAEVHTNYVAKILAEKYGGKSFMIHSPAVLDSREAKEILEKDSNIKEIMDLADSVNTSVLGMSDIGLDSTMIETGNFTVEDFNYLESLGVAGDVNLVFLDKNGKQVISKIDDRIVRAPAEKLRKMKNVIGIAFGPKKNAIIKASIKSGLINILLTDENTATRLLEEK